jgi:hypothetical protein
VTSAQLLGRGGPCQSERASERFCQLEQSQLGFHRLTLQ